MTDKPLPTPPADNPWQTISSNPVYENPWIEVIHNEVINVSGNPGIYGKVHFKNTAVAVLPLDNQNNTWLVGQHRYPLDLYSWEVPEGGAPLGADTLEAARRELREETGIVAGQWSELLRLHLSNSVSDEQAVGYIARDLQFTAAEPEDCEQLEVVKLPFEQALAMALDGRITDALAVACLLKAAHLMHTGKL